VPAITTLVGDRAWWPTGSGLAAMLRGWPAGASAPLALGAAAPDLDPDAEPGHGAPEPSVRRRPAVLALVALVPVAFALLFTWSLSGQAGSLRGLTAAVVDLDTGSLFTAPDGSTRPLRLGDQLVADLTRGDATDGLTWQAADPAAARDGLAAGRYDLVLTVPGDFSASIAAIRGDATGHAPRATLTLETVGATHPAAANAAASISRAIADTTRVGIVSSYVDDVLVRVDGAHDDLATAATRATTVAAGSTDLEAGASDVSSLAGSLVSGLQELAAGASDAGDGSRAMADGLTSLAGGARRLADGTTELAGGLRAARNGAAQVAGGAGALSDGLDALSTSAAGLPGQAGALADGAAAVSDGVEGIAAGARTLADSLAEVRAGTAGLGDEAAALDAGATGLVSGSHDLAGGLALARQAADDLHAGTTELAGSVDTYTAQVQELAASCATLGGSATLCAQLEAVATAGADLGSGADVTRAGAARLEDSFADLVAGADELVDGARTLAGGTGGLAASAPLLERGVVGSANGADDLAARAAELATGAHRTASGAAALSGGLAALVGGIGDAASGAGAVSDGAHGVADGLSTAAGAARTLTSGARAVARGAEELATGATGAASGAATLTDALGQALDGARLVEAGSEAVVTDQQALSGEAAALATELQSSSGAVPGYEPSARDNVAQRVADPVGVSVTSAGTAGGEDLAPYFMALGLLIGALAAALILPAIGRPGWPAGRSRRLVVAIVGASAVAGVQGSLVVIAMPLVAGTDAVSPAALGGVALLAALTFAALTQALVALLGRRGWFLALLLVALQLTSAGWPYPIDAAPWPLRLVHPLVPMTYAVDGLRAAATGVGSIGIPAVVLAGWLLAATLVVLGVAARPGRAAEGPAPRTPSPA
jgi:putative membrane protein